MKRSVEKFLASPRKAVTLIGMSGVGKSYLSGKMEGWGWCNYSCDHLIGSQYLKDQLGGGAEGVSAQNIAGLSDFVGQIGDPEKGGLPLDEFRRRQALYYEAERSVLKDMPVVLQGVEGHFVNDSSGSLCEVEDGDVIRGVADCSLFVYLKVPQEDHAEILQRAISYPKPLYFPPAFLDDHLKKYMQQFDLSRIEQIDPVEFLRWVFPYLFQSRLPKYQALADAYGVTVSSKRIGAIKSEGDFFDLIRDSVKEAAA